MPEYPSHLQFINPSGLSTPPGFTHVVEVTGGRTIYLSGQVAVDPAFHLVGKGDFRAQAEQVFENLKTGSNCLPVPKLDRCIHFLRERERGFLYSSQPGSNYLIALTQQYHSFYTVVI